LLAPAALCAIYSMTAIDRSIVSASNVRRRRRANLWRIGGLRMRRMIMAFGLAALAFGQACAQQDAPQAKEFDKPPLLTLRTRIPLPDVYGRMDHYGWDSKRANLIVSALGNDTVEIVNSWKRVRTVTGLEHPQAAVYVPGIDRIAVSSQSGKLRFYDAESY